MATPAAASLILTLKTSLSFLYSVKLAGSCQTEASPAADQYGRLVSVQTNSLHFAPAWPHALGWRLESLPQPPLSSASLSSLALDDSTSGEASADEMSAV